MKTFPLVGIIILTYNSEAIIERCLSSFEKLNYPRKCFYVLDNASSDNTVTVVRGNFPGLKLLRSEDNFGYTGGNNLGLEAALLAGCEYVLVVNPDTVLLNPNFLTSLVAELEEQPLIGIAGPRVFLRAADVVQNTILFPPSLWRNLVHWVRFRWDSTFAQLSGNTKRSALVLNGVCVLLRAECLRQIGLFDESLFMYIEDADQAFRAHLANWRISYFPVDSVIHEQKTQGYDETSVVASLLKRNSAHYLIKTGSPVSAVGYMCLSLALFVAKSCLRINQGYRSRHVSFVHRLMTDYYQSLAGKSLGRRYVEGEV